MNRRGFIKNSFLAGLATIVAPPISQAKLTTPKDLRLLVEDKPVVEEKPKLVEIFVGDRHPESMMTVPEAGSLYFRDTGSITGPEMYIKKPLKWDKCQ